MGFKSSRWVVASVAVVAGIASAQTAADIQLWDSTWAQYQALESVPVATRPGYAATSTPPLTIVIKGEVKDVFDIYSNVFNAQGLHPFLIGTTPIRHTRNSFDFISYENIPLPDGSIFPGVTIAQQRYHRSQNYYDADTYDYPGIVTHQHITFARTGKKEVTVTENLSFEAPFDFIGLAAQGGYYAHYLVQQGLKAKIEAGALKPIRFPCYLPGVKCEDEGDENEDD